MAHTGHAEMYFAMSFSKAGHQNCCRAKIRVRRTPGWRASLDAWAQWMSCKRRERETKSRFGGQPSGHRQFWSASITCCQGCTGTKIALAFLAMAAHHDFLYNLPRHPAYQKCTFWHVKNWYTQSNKRMMNSLSLKPTTTTFYKCLLDHLLSDADQNSSFKSLRKPCEEDLKVKSSDEQWETIGKIIFWRNSCNKIIEPNHKFISWMNITPLRLSRIYLNLLSKCNRCKTQIGYIFHMFWNI